MKRLLVGALLLLVLASGGCKGGRSRGGSDSPGPGPPVPNPPVIPAPSALVLGIIGAGLVALRRRLKA